MSVPSIDPRPPPFAIYRRLQPAYSIDLSGRTYEIFHAPKKQLVGKHIQLLIYFKQP